MDKDNAIFNLVSESCLPLHTFQTMKTALFEANKSIVNACDQPKSLEGRYIPELDSIPGMNSKMWRKSSQWFSLTRSHAELVVNDNVLIKPFMKGALIDEHYIPTLLAWKNLEAETTCRGGFAYVKFMGHPHPQTFYPRDINSELFKQLREDAYCSGTKLCHFTARKFSVSCISKLYEHIDDILVSAS